MQEVNSAPAGLFPPLTKIKELPCTKFGRRVCYSAGEIDALAKERVIVLG